MDRMVCSGLFWIVLCSLCVIDGLTLVNLTVFGTKSLY